jgi:glyoxylase-like metal-dependent hydrolase (beta-lactamase superfamily II)
MSYVPLAEPSDMLECRILDTGYCLAWEDHMIDGGAHRRIHCHSIVALLHHPREGWILWDTGYGPRMVEETRRFPFSLYARITPLRLDLELAVVSQLSRLQLSPADIKWIVLSHFHADHLAGLREFPAAHIVASRAAYDAVAQRRGFGALRRAFIPALLPDDFEQRTTFLTDFSGPSLPHLGPTLDLFGDGALLLVRLPGHARGQLGLFAGRTTRGPVLLAADSCWLSRSFRERRMPARITNLIVDNPREVRQTIDALHDFALACPEVAIIPSHCPEAFSRELRIAA